jgi:(E)-4-hydroxy-3-methyl-but-2-enyl pyrophosphate reductase
MKKRFGITVAKSAGFCPGVKKAIDCAIDLSRSKKCPIYTLGPLIHNTQVIETLEEKGIRSVNGTDEIKDAQAVLIIRAHGITPELEGEIKSHQNIEVVDATCPLVKNVQSVIAKYAEQNYSTVIVGDKGHAEVIGLMGYAKNNGTVVANAEEAKKLPSFERVNIVSQTTQEENIFNEVVKEIQRKSKTVVVSDTICQPTKERQNEIKSLCENVDLMIVVGAKHSANTTRLAKICQKLCENSIHVENEDELNNYPISQYKKIGVTAGASTPSWMIQKVSDKLYHLRKSKFEFMINLVENAWAFIINSCSYTALAAVALTFVCMKMQGTQINEKFLLLSFFFVWSLHIINRTYEKGSGKSETKVLFFYRHKKTSLFTGFVSGMTAVGLSLSLGINTAILVFVFWLLGVIYPFRHLIGLRKSLNFPGSKDILTALGWGFVCAAIPAMSKGIIFTKANHLSLTYATFLVFLRSVMLGISAVHSDLIVGKENFYKALGAKKVHIILFSILMILTAILVLLFSMNWKTPLIVSLSIGNIYMLTCFGFYFFNKMPKGIWAETIIDGNFLILGIISYLAIF